MFLRCYFICGYNGSIARLGMGFGKTVVNLTTNLCSLPAPSDTVSCRGRVKRGNAKVSVTNFVLLASCLRYAQHDPYRCRLLVEVSGSSFTLLGVDVTLYQILVCGRANGTFVLSNFPTAPPLSLRYQRLSSLPSVTSSPLQSPLPSPRFEVTNIIGCIISWPVSLADSTCDIGRRCSLRSFRLVACRNRAISSPTTSPAAGSGKALIYLGLIFIHSVATQAGPPLLQFTSKQLDWPLAKTRHLLSIKALVAVIVLMVLIPLINRLAGGKGHSSLGTGIDSVVCWMSLLLVVGNFITGFGRDGAVFIVAKSHQPAPISRMECRGLQGHNYLGIVMTSCGTAFPQSI